MDHLPMLKNLHIRITSSCNFNCRHCYAADWLPQKYELSIAEIISVIDQAMALGCRNVTFSGGEPLMAQDIVAALGYCLEQNIKASIETNGTFVDKLVSRLGEDRARHVSFAVSYDGKKMRDERFVRLVKENILKLVDLGCNVRIQTAITKVNVDEVDEIFQFSRAHGIKNRCFLAHSPTGNGKNIPSFNAKEWLTLIKNVTETYPNVMIEVPDIFPGRKKRKCGWGVHRCEVMPNGDVTSCAPRAFAHKGFVAGNIKESSLKELWGSQHFVKIRQLRQSDFKMPCARCIYWQNCLGSCRSLASSNGKMLLSPHPFCQAVYDLAEHDKLDRSLLQDPGRVDAWLQGLQDAENDLVGSYRACVEKQHREEAGGKTI